MFSAFLDVIQKLRDHCSPVCCEEEDQPNQNRIFGFCFILKRPGSNSASDQELIYVCGKADLCGGPSDREVAPFNSKRAENKMPQNQM